MKKDNVFSNPINKIVDFKFDENVANVFEDMLRRSVPGYATIISTTGMLTKIYAKSNSNFYDLGSSLGASALSMQQSLTHPNCKVIGVDNSEAMIERSRQLLEQSKSSVPIELVCDDIRNVKIENASVVVLNYTLQFIEPDSRETILQNIYNGLNKGGILILSEKIVFNDSALNERQIKRYYDFKRLQGYSELEISQKRNALENVLIPETSEQLLNRLEKAGFKHSDLWFQLYNFISIVAEK
ncbi:MAG: carboxy-S-adenosyl-L-methionine synthase CmoA [Bacteroidota bacterium]